MDNLIKNAIVEIAKLSCAATDNAEKLTSGGREYVLNRDTGVVEELVPLFESPVERPSSAAVRSLVDAVKWANATDRGDELSGVLLIGHGTSGTFPFPARRDEAGMSVGSNAVEVDERRRMSPSSFSEWIDKSVMADDQRALLEAALGGIKAESYKDTEIVRNGPMLAIKQSKGDRVEGMTKLPRRITITTPVFDPGFSTEVEFAVSAEVCDGDVYFTLSWVNKDAAYEDFRAWATDVVDGNIPKGWTFLFGS